MNIPLLLAALILLGIWYYNTTIGYPEFFASDWMASHYGPALWNGWNYGTAAPRQAPTPEYPRQ